MTGRAGGVGGASSEEEPMEGVGRGDSCCKELRAGISEGSADSEAAREGVKSVSEGLRSPSLAMDPVSTFIEETDIAPGVRGPGARRFERGWVSRRRVVGPVEDVGVSLTEVS